MLFIIGRVRGLKTLGLGSSSFSLLTIRLACDAVNIVFSLGELPYVADVGLRRRLMRRELVEAAEPNCPPEIRLIAEVIFMASSLLAFQLSLLSGSGLLE